MNFLNRHSALTSYMYLLVAFDNPDASPYVPLGQGFQSKPVFVGQ